MLQPGSLIGRYEIQRRIGRGGMGTVYVAHDPVLGRMVAVKVFLSDLDVADAAQRFAREARSAAALNHANIVTIHDFGEVASQPFIVMEYIQGETLYEVIRRKAAVPAADRLRWMEELCAGVAYAHQVGVVHRDLKPTNLMVDRSGRLKILDFGIAKMLGTLATNATALIGTPGYMAPEQILGKSIDQRSDLFSIGVVGYELFSYADAFAFPGDTVPTITHRILTAEPTPLTEVVPDIHPDLVSIIERAIKKSADERFPDAEAMRAAINGVRRQIDGGAGWGTATAAPHAGGAGDAHNRRGTGSARQAVNDAVGIAELTPPPDPRGTDREAALARRRASQIQAALDLGQTLFDQGELEAALDACEQALTLDGSHAEALQLESRIRAAMGKVRAGTLLDEARGELEKGALTAAQDLLQQARALDPEAADARRLERDLRLARVEQERIRQRAETAAKTLGAARQALEQRNVEAALALAREVLTLDPDSVEAHTIEAEAMRRLDEDTGGTVLSHKPLPATMLSPGLAGGDVGVASAPAADKTILAPPRRTPAPAPSAPPPAAKRAHPAGTPVVRPQRDLLAPVRAVLTSTRGAVAATTTRQRQMIGGGLAGVLLAAAALVYVLRPVPAAPQGTLVIDAVPWATITAIEAEDGTAHDVPHIVSTPAALSLPAGTYRVTLTGPPPGSETRQLSVQVQEGTVTPPQVERFASLTPEEYFEPYLAAQAAAQGDAAPLDEAATEPAAPAAPESVPPDPAPAARPPGVVE